LLIQHGASLEIEESECQHTPLALALILDCQWAATELILNGANCIVFASSGRSPLYIAAEKGANAMISLVQSRVNGTDSTTPFDVNQHVSTAGMLTMMQVACFHNQAHTVAFLIELGADLKLLNSYGNTPLITSLLCKNAQAAVLLVSAGAAVHTPSRDGVLPM
jgi:ankyrin repeat protein